MKSRMERYYNDETEHNERVKKNKELYDTIYQLDPLNDVNDIATSNEVDLSKVTTVSIKSREEYHRLNEYKDIIQDKKDDLNHDSIKQNDEEKIYDINTVIEKAKQERNVDEETKSYYKLRNTQYDILNGLNVDSKMDVTKEETESDEERLKELINTITMNKRVLNELSKQEETNELLSDLMPSGNTITTTIEIDSKTDAIASSDEHTQNMDESFYTSSLDLKKEDFEEEVKELESAVKVNNTLIKILLFVLVIIVTVIILFILNNYTGLNIFKK